MHRLRASAACVSLLLALLLSACGNAQPPAASPVADEHAAPTGSTPVTAEETPEQAAPTDAPTPEPTETPLAARVNGEGIALADYEVGVARYEAGFAIRGVDPATQGDYGATVLEIMITDRLVGQEARARGHTVSDEEVQAEYDRSVAAAGGEGQFQEWLALNLYTTEDYRAQLREGLLANRVQSEVVATVPDAVEQVHARHILVAAAEDAQALRAQLDAGADFATLAVDNSQDQSTRINGGDLGWFPRGVLTAPELEDVAFAQEPGAISDVVSTFLGFHIVETLETDAARALTPEFRLLLQQAAIDEWIAELRARATVERFVP